MGQGSMLLGVIISLSLLVQSVSAGRTHDHTRRTLRRQVSDGSIEPIIIEKVCTSAGQGTDVEEEKACSTTLLGEIASTRSSFCATRSSRLDACLAGRSSDGTSDCHHQREGFESCRDTARRTYWACYQAGQSSPSEVVFCANSRLNVHPPAIPSLSTASRLSQGLSPTPLPSTQTTVPIDQPTTPIIVTTAIPFFTNNSIAYLSTTATIPPFQNTSQSGFRTGLPPLIPPAFSQTGIWTNTNGSFRTASAGPTGGTGDWSVQTTAVGGSAGDRSGTFVTSTATSATSSSGSFMSEGSLCDDVVTTMVAVP